MKNLITDIAGVRVGHAGDAALASGVTAIIFDSPAVASIEPLLDTARPLAFALLLPLVFLAIGNGLRGESVLPRLMLYASALGAGSFTGFQFPLSSKIYLEAPHQRNSGQVAGLIYGADLLGGTAALDLRNDP